MDREPQPLDVLYLDEHAGIQFRIRPFHLRIVTVDPPQFPNLPGRWVHGYELLGQEAVDKRTVYISNLQGARLVFDGSSLPPWVAQTRTAGARRTSVKA